MPRSLEAQDGIEDFRIRQQEEEPVVFNGYGFEELTQVAVDAIDTVSRNEEGKLNIVLKHDVVWDTKANPSDILYARDQARLQLVARSAMYIAAETKLANGDNPVDLTIAMKKLDSEAAFITNPRPGYWNENAEFPVGKISLQETFSRDTEELLEKADFQKGSRKWIYSTAAASAVVTACSTATEQPPAIVTPAPPVESGSPQFNLAEQLDYGSNYGGTTIDKQITGNLPEAPSDIAPKVEAALVSGGYLGEGDQYAILGTAITDTDNDKEFQVFVSRKSENGGPGLFFYTDSRDTLPYFVPPGKGEADNPGFVVPLYAASSGNIIQIGFAAGAEGQKTLTQVLFTCTKDENGNIIQTQFTDPYSKLSFDIAGTPNWIPDGLMKEVSLNTSPTPVAVGTETSVAPEPAPQAGVVPESLKSQAEQLAAKGYEIRDGEIVQRDEQGTEWSVAKFNPDGSATIKALDGSYRGMDATLSVDEVARMETVSLNAGSDELIVIKNKDTGKVEKMFLSNNDKNQSTEAGWIAPLEISDDPRNPSYVSSLEALSTEWVLKSAQLKMNNKDWPEGTVPIRFYYNAGAQFVSHPAINNKFGSMEVQPEGMPENYKGVTGRPAGFVEIQTPEGRVLTRLTETLIDSNGKSVILCVGFGDRLKEEPYKLSNGTNVSYLYDILAGENKALPFVVYQAIGNNLEFYKNGLDRNDVVEQVYEKGEQKPWEIFPEIVGQVESLTNEQLKSQGAINVGVGVFLDETKLEELQDYLLYWYYPGY